MSKKRRIDVRGILADPDLRRELMVSTVRATQAREGIATSRDQAERAYYVVTEGERVACFDLARFQVGHGPEGREAMFSRSLSGKAKNVRVDIARSDFSAIEGMPLAFRRIGIISDFFRQAPTLEPAWGVARQGKATGDDPRWIRQWWEVANRQNWPPFAKGGEFCRFYYDAGLVIDWKEEHRELLKKSGNALPSIEYYFRPGLTWPLRTQRGFNLRVMPEGCIFGHKGPAIFLSRQDDSFYVLGIANSEVAEYILQGLTSFGSWEVGVVKRLPILEPTTSAQRERIASHSQGIHDAKAQWDEGNEICTRFQYPWLLRDTPTNHHPSLTNRLDRLIDQEIHEEARIKKLYGELNEEVYQLYGIPPSTRTIIKETLGKRPPEVLWPQMEGATVEQKRMEHVFRLLSYVVKRVVEADEDGIVPFTSSSGEVSVLDRVHRELASLFPLLDAGQLEAEITNELKRSVKGYRRTSSIAQWLENAFFEYHCSLYKSRPIFWHLASSQGTQRFAFGVLCHYHKLDRNRMGKIRSQYLRDAIEMFRREAALADKAGQAEARLEWLARLEETQEFDRRLQWVQEGYHEGAEGGERDYRILTPWKSPEERPQGWDPDFDDGVKVNIEPLQKAGVLRLARVVG